MCGIAGWLGHLADGSHYAKRLARALYHRGPDACGIESWDEATFVHTHLNIRDHAFTGRRPMSNEDGMVWAILDGKITNHHELRNSLKACGHIFTGHTDTEVIAHLYEEEGASFVSKLHGLFAIAVYDTRSRTLILARDRFGGKPLFYAPGDERFAFASEIRALLELPGIDHRPDRQAIYDFSTLLYIPAPATSFVGIRAVQPGERLAVCLTSNKVVARARTFHYWRSEPQSELTLEEATEQAEGLLRQAIQRHLESEVPWGTALSGGMNSSLVSSLAQAAIGGGLRTFHVRLSQEGTKETQAAQTVADSIGSNHLTIGANATSRTWHEISDLLVNAGQPFADTSMFVVNAICQALRQHVSLVLFGDGGGTSFRCYHRDAPVLRLTPGQTFPAPLWQASARRFGLLAPVRFNRARLPRRMNLSAATDDTTFVQQLFCWLTEEEQQQLSLASQLLPARRLFESQWSSSVPSSTSRFERLTARVTEANVRLALPNALLFKIDTVSMRSSLEVRVPMLDEELFSFVLSLPYHLQVSERIGPQVLRTVATSRPTRGSCFTGTLWADANFKTCVRETLLGQSSALSEYFHPVVYRPWVEAFCAGKPYPNISVQALSQRVMMLLAVHFALSPFAQGKKDRTFPLARHDATYMRQTLH